MADFPLNHPPSEPTVEDLTRENAELRRQVADLTTLLSEREGVLATGDGSLSAASGDPRRYPQPGPVRILVMDNDRTIRMVLERYLRSIGYGAVAVGDGATAVERYRKEREEGRPFAAVIMNLSVPGGMGAQETMAHLLRIDPAVTAVVSSCYTTDPLIARYREYGFQAVLAKPYQLHDLELVIRQLVAS